MASTYTPSLRLNLQAAGDNINTWGLVLNSGVFGLVDTSISGRLALSLSGSVTLTSLNGVADQARNAMIHVTSGTGGIITIPAVSKIYQVLNGSSGTLTITAGASSSTLVVGESSFVMCDGSNVTKLIPQGFPTPANSTDAANKAYVDSLAFATTGALPGINAGTAGQYVTNNGTLAFWGNAGYAGVLPLTAGYTVVSTDKEKLFRCSGTFTVAFQAAATLGTKFCVYLQNSGTGDITLDPNGSETIDGLTTYIMYPGEARLVVCDGSVLTTVVLSPFSKTFTANGTFTKPPGYSRFGFRGWGSGASGARGAGSQPGGPGGGCWESTLLASALGVTETVTVGAGGAARTTDGTANPGANTTLGTVLTIGGATANDGGGTGAADINPSYLKGAAGNNAASGAVYGGGGISLNASTDSGSSVFGGGGGGGTNGVVARAAGSSTYGGSGGVASLVGNGADGVAPGGGGGATNTGTRSGAGARGELQLWGVA